MQVCDMHVLHVIHATCVSKISVIGIVYRTKDRMLQLLSTFPVTTFHNVK